MIQVTIPAEDRIQLFKERFTHPHPHVMKKMEALYQQFREKKIAV